MQIDNSLKVLKLSGNLSEVSAHWAAASAALEELVVDKADLFQLTFGSNYADTIKALGNVSIKSAIWFCAHNILKGRAFQKTMKGASRSQLGSATNTMVSEMNLFLGKGTIGTISIDMASLYLSSLMCFGKSKRNEEIMDLGDGAAWASLPVQYRWVGSIGAIPVATLTGDNSKVLIAYDNWLQKYIEVRRRGNTGAAGTDSKTRTRQQYRRLINAVDEAAKQTLWDAVKTSAVTWVEMTIQDESQNMSEGVWQKLMSVF